MPKLLIIDDDISLCDFLRNFFHKRGYQVFIATDGRQGLSVMREQKPNIIFLDMIIFPEEFGLDILKQIKKIDNKAKVIMLTGVGDKGIIELAKMYGASDYITKPFNLEQLEKEVMPKLI